MGSKKEQEKAARRKVSDEEKKIEEAAAAREAGVVEGPQPPETTFRPLGYQVVHLGDGGAVIRFYAPGHIYAPVLDPAQKQELAGFLLTDPATIQPPTPEIVQP